MLKKQNAINKMKNLVDISSMITHSVDFFEIKDKIVDKMLEVIDPKKACVNLFYDTDYDYAYLVCSKTLTEIPNIFTDVTDKGIKIKFDNYPQYIQEAIEKEKIIYIPDICEDNRSCDEIELSKQEGYEGRVVFPLVVNYNVVGFMTCFLSKGDVIEEEDLDFISSIAALISLSIDVTMRNNTSEELINKLREAIISINSATEKLYQNRDINEFLNHISKQACEITKSSESIITIETSKTLKKVLSLYRADDKNQSDIFPILPEIKNNKEIGNFINNRENKQDNINRYIYYKLNNEDEVFGYIVCANSRKYTNDDLSILSILTKQIYLAIKLFEYNIVETNHKVLANELDILNKQQKLLMDEKKINDGMGKSLDFYHKASKVVGGDFYYSVKIDDNKIAFILADVMGHGIVSNYVVALIKGAFKALSKTSKSSGEILTKINEVLFDEFDKMEIFATGVVCIMDSKKNILQISNAGHYFPLILNKSQEIENDKKLKKGMPIGVLENIHYDTEELDLADIDAMWMYTDGIIEVKNESKEEFGIERLEDILKDSYDKNYELIVNELEQALYRFSKKRNYEDDILLVMLKNNKH